MVSLPSCDFNEFAEFLLISNPSAFNRLINCEVSPNLLAAYISSFRNSGLGGTLLLESRLLLSDRSIHLDLQMKSLVFEGMLSVF